MTTTQSSQEINKQGLKEVLSRKISNLEQIANGNLPNKITDWLEGVCEFKRFYEKAIPYLKKEEIKERETQYERTAIKYWEMRKNDK